MPRRSRRGQHFQTVDSMLDREGRLRKVSRSYASIDPSCPSTVAGFGVYTAADAAGGNALEDPADGARAGVRRDRAAARLSGTRAGASRSSSKRRDILPGWGICGLVIE